MKKMSGTKKTLFGLLLGLSLVFGGGSAIVSQDGVRGKDPELTVVTGQVSNPSESVVMIPASKDPEILATATFVDSSSPVLTVAINSNGPDIPIRPTLH
jgi:hypothetical protein